MHTCEMLLWLISTIGTSKAETSFYAICSRAKLFSSDNQDIMLNLSKKRGLKVCAGG